MIFFHFTTVPGRWGWFTSLLHYATAIPHSLSQDPSTWVTGFWMCCFITNIRHSVLHVQTAWHIIKTQFQSLKCITEEVPCMAGRWSTTGTLAPGASRTLPLHSGTLAVDTLVLHSATLWLVPVVDTLVLHSPCYIRSTLSRTLLLLSC